METSSENINTEKSESLSFPENEKSEARSQYTLNGIVLFLSENLGRAIGKLTRESERILSKVRQKAVAGVKEAGKAARDHKTKASKTETEDIPVDSTNETKETEEKTEEDAAKASTEGTEGVALVGKDEAAKSKEVNDDATGVQSDAVKEPEEGTDKETASQEAANSVQDASGETKEKTASTKGRPRKSKEEAPANDDSDEKPPSDEEE